ncbi:WxL protein peptidoglycan domain-containing protein [Oceanobacillus massiliensis]|uniref:WxL protein peptidoglycan domain-containing protein n=1 Tax=Oceanobacillus massiliensis TaxID=1465765 RepID=UPI000287A657|nr:DUF916 domain-containing protein [Oceanobacillus massiliensis]
MKIRLFFILAIILCCLPLHTLAEDEDAPLEIEPVYPDNQLADTKGYFNLLVEPGETQTLELRVANNLDTELTLAGSSANAYTHPTGGMLYGTGINSENSILLDDAIHLADLIKIDESITIPPQSTVNVPIEVTSPDEDGQTFLGAVILTTEPESMEVEETAENDSANVILNTETSYTVALQLNLPAETTPDFSLGGAGFLNGTGEVFIEMTNNAHLIQEEIIGEYAVSDQEGNELFSGEIPSFKMAPKSQIRYSIPWQNETLADGTYTLNLNGTAGGEEFSASETFTIENEDIQEFEEKNLPNTTASGNTGIPIWIWIAGAVVFGMLMFIIGKKIK